MALREISKKVVVVGDANVGKSSLLGALQGHTFSQNYTPTVFDTSEARISVKGKVSGEHVSFNLRLHDTSGDPDYDRLRPLSYMDSHLVLLCYAMDSSHTMKNVSAKWVPEINHILPEVPILLIGTKSDTKCTGSSDSSSEGHSDKPDPDDVQDVKSLDIEEDPAHDEKDGSHQGHKVSGTEDEDSDVPSDSGGEDDDPEVGVNQSLDEALAQTDNTNPGGGGRNYSDQLAAGKRVAMRTKKFSLDARQKSLEAKRKARTMKKKHSLEGKLDLLALNNFPQDLSHLDEVDFTPEERKVSTQKGKVLSWAIRAHAYVECSAKEDVGLDEVKEAMARLLEQEGSRRQWRKLSKMVTL